MGESLTQRRRVRGRRLSGRKPPVKREEPRCRLILLRLTVPLEEAPANSVPAAAVIRKVRALIGITGRKALVGGFVSQV